MKQWQVPPHEVFPLISSRQSSRDAPMPSPHPVSKGPGPGASKMTLWDSEVSEPAPNPSQRALCVLPGGPVSLPKLGLHLMILLELGGCPWRSRPHPRNNLPPPQLSHVSLPSPSQASFYPAPDFFSHLQFLSGFDFIREGRSSCCPGVSSFKSFLGVPVPLLAAVRCPWLSAQGRLGGDESFSYPVLSFSTLSCTLALPGGGVRVQGWE